jgi:hypothetical protein
MRKASLLLIVILLLGTALAYSADKSKNKKPEITIPKISEPPKIDGNLDDSCWNKATKLDGFYKFEPVDGEPSSEETVVFLVYDNENLYVAFQCFDKEKDKIRAHISKRDAAYNDDFVVVILDTFNSQRRGYQIGCNPLGIQIDAFWMEGEDDDESFDLIFYSDGKLNEDGYAVELAIPFKSLRFPQGKIHNIGFGAGRVIPRKNEKASWPPLDMSKSTIFDQFAEVKELEGIEYSKNIEILPSFTALQTGTRNEQGIFKNNSADSDFGLGVKYGITPNITFDFTYNPDFSQVEADAEQVDVNLRYELYFDEKRPFFLEGADIFSSDIEVFYSRRIIDPLYGAKVTGKIGKATFAFLSALDEGPGRQWAGEENPHLGEKAFFNVFRGKYDLFGNSWVGFLMTNRQFTEASNNVFGFDGVFNFKKNYKFSFQGLGSYTTTEEGEKLSAPAFTAQFGRFSKHLEMAFSYNDLYPNFKADTGFIKRTDIRQGRFYIGYKFRPNKSWILTFQPDYIFNSYYDHDGILVEQENQASIDFEFPKQTYFSLFYNDMMERWANIDFKKKSFSVNLHSEPTSYFTGGFYFYMGKSIYYSKENPYLGYKHIFETWLSFLPNPRLKTELDFTKNTFWREKGGEQVYDYNIIRSKTTYQFTKKLFLRSILEYNAYWDELTTDFLLSYMYNHGTVFFFGYGGLYDTNHDMPFRQNSRSFFVKISYLWRL